MKVAISGSKGNLGQHIIKNANFFITEVGREGWNQSMSGHDVFIHCAYDLKKKITEKPEEVVESNILTVMKALQLCRDNNISKFIFISSCSVYGHSSKCNEDMEVVPASINGNTKLLCEKIILEFCHENNIKCLILRVFNSYAGDDQFSVVSKMQNAIAGKEFFLCNGGESERDYIHINDVAKVICHYVDNSSKYEVVNVGTGRTRKIKDVLSVMQDTLGDFQVRHITNSNEVVYSRANNTRLLEDITAIEFIDIFDFIRSLRE